MIVYVRKQRTSRRGLPLLGDIESSARFVAEWLNRTKQDDVWRCAVIGYATGQWEGPFKFVTASKRKYPQVAPAFAGILELEGHFCVEEDGRLTFNIGPSIASADGERSQVLVSVGTLMNAGELNRVKRCQHCGKFFFAKPAHKKACSVNCRVMNWQQTEKGKAAKVAYMRKSRADQKERDRRALERDRN